MRSIAILLLAVFSVVLAIDAATGARLGGTGKFDATMLFICLVLLAFYTIWPRLRKRDGSGAVTASDAAENSDDELGAEMPVEDAAVGRELENKEG